MSATVPYAGGMDDAREHLREHQASPRLPQAAGQGVQQGAGRAHCQCACGGHDSATATAAVSDGAYVAEVLAEMLKLGLALLAKRWPHTRPRQTCPRCGHRG